ncbi:hypothetical protein HDU76_004868 [Blyttiomyces sp. JEL0837]|nr:hypothetical protein HDU76_004868 [Blyttiomyces sp. JEL0837]
MIARHFVTSGVNRPYGRSSKSHDQRLVSSYLRNCYTLTPIQVSVQNCNYVRKRFNSSKPILNLNEEPYSPEGKQAYPSSEDPLQGHRVVSKISSEPGQPSNPLTSSVSIEHPFPFKSPDPAFRTGTRTTFGDFIRQPPEEFGESVRRFSDEMKGGIVGGVKTVVGSADDAVMFVTEMGAEAAVSTDEAGKKAAENVKKGVEKVAETGDDAIEGVKAGIGMVGSKAKNVAERVVETVKEGGETVREAGRAAYEGAKEMFQGAKELGEKYVQDVQEGVGKARDVGRDMMEGVEGRAERFGEGVKETSREAVEGAKEGTQKAYELGREAAEGVGKRVRDAGEAMKETGREAVEGAREGAKKVGEMGREALEGVKELAGNFGERMKETGRETMEGAKDLGNEAMENVKEPLGRWERGRHLDEVGNEKVPDVGRTVVGGVKEQVENASDSLNDAGRGAVNVVRDAVGGGKEEGDRKEGGGEELERFQFQAYMEEVRDGAQPVDEAQPVTQHKATSKGHSGTKSDTTPHTELPDIPDPRSGRTELHSRNQSMITADSTINSITQHLQEESQPTDITSHNETAAAQSTSTSPTTLSASRPRRNIRPPSNYTQDFIPTPSSITSGVAAIVQMEQEQQMNNRASMLGSAKKRSPGGGFVAVAEPPAKKQASGQDFDNDDMEFDDGGSGGLGSGSGSGSGSTSNVQVVLPSSADDDMDEDADEWGIPGMDEEGEEAPVQHQPAEQEQIEVAPVKRRPGRQKGFKVNKNAPAKPTTTSTRKPRRSSGAASAMLAAGGDARGDDEADEMASAIWGPEEALKRPEMPVARIKTIMKEDKEVTIVSADATLAVACATEMFLEMMAKLAYSVTEGDNRRTVAYKDLVRAISAQDRFEFLKDIIPPTIPLRKAMALRESLQDNQGGQNDA